MQDLFHTHTGLQHSLGSEQRPTQVACDRIDEIDADNHGHALNGGVVAVRAQHDHAGLQRHEDPSEWVLSACVTRIDGPCGTCPSALATERLAGEVEAICAVAWLCQPPSTVSTPPLCGGRLQDSTSSISRAAIHTCAQEQ